MGKSTISMAMFNSHVSLLVFGRGRKLEPEVTGVPPSWKRGGLASMEATGIYIYIHIST